MSPRSPSTFKSLQTSEIFLLISGEMVTLFRLFLATIICLANSALSPAYCARKPFGSSANCWQPSTICTRSSGSRSVRIMACMPKRSSNWGRSSPSSGLPLPTRMNLAGCRTLIPSRSTVFQPPAALSSKTSTRWSSKRFTSSTYRMPRLALASNPGSKAFLPWVRAFSISIVPQTRSSVAPRGKSIIGTFFNTMGNSSLFAFRFRTSSLMLSNSVGEELYGSSATVSISGSRSTRARIVVVLPVPRSPRIMTPPIFGSITLRMRASFISD
mmetsp:Transcript_144035/g.359112  ORF Transcript_144035/g.359112 Transcript_144035/m.359112 type:complete len:271 (+) Transcript_144035:354-1166(+)